LGILGGLDFLGIIYGLVFGGKYLDLDFDFWFQCCSGWLCCS